MTPVEQQEYISHMDNIIRRHLATTNFCHSVRKVKAMNAVIQEDAHKQIFKGTKAASYSHSLKPDFIFMDVSLNLFFPNHQ